MLQFTVELWTSYPTQLPALCNTAQLADLVNTVFEQDDWKIAFRVGQDFVGHLMKVLSDEQLQELEKEGVCRKLTGLLSHYDNISPEHLQLILCGVHMFAKLKSFKSYFDESLYTNLLFAAQKCYSHATIQQLIWRLFAFLGQQDEEYMRQLASTHTLSAIVPIIQQEGSHINPLLQFLITVCCHTEPNSFIQHCLENQELMRLLLELIRMNSPSSKLETVVKTCNFIASLCSRCSGDGIQIIFDLKLVVRLEKCAQKWPDTCLLPTCIAIKGAVNLFSSGLSVPPTSFTGSLNRMKAEFYAENHHRFWIEMLSNPSVSSNSDLVNVMYVTFMKLLQACTQEALAQMCEKDFIESFVNAFIRDTNALPTLANYISFCSYHFVSRIKSKKAIECFKEQNFHIAVTDLIATTESYDVTVTAMGLLACLMNKYHDHLKDIKPLLKSQLPDVLLEKAKKYGKMPQSKFGSNFRRIMLNLTADKELSLEMYNRGYMDHLVGHIHENCIPTVKQTLIDAIGNIALGGSHIKQVLLDQQIYIPMLTILQEQLENGDPYLLSACCRMLEILASSDWAKRKFFEHGCVDLLGKLMKQRKDNAELCWWALELLSSIGWVSSINRRYILTQDVIETVIVILKECTDKKVISSTFYVFLLSGELDEGSTRLKELGVEELLRKAIENPKYKKERSNIEKLGTRVLEQQALYTIFVPQQTISLPPPSSPFTIDWPPQPENSPLVDEEEAFSSSPNSLVSARGNQYGKKTSYGGS